MMAYGGDLAKWIIYVINEIYPPPPHTHTHTPTPFGNVPRHLHTLFMTTALHFDIYTNFYIVMHHIFS